MLLVSSGVHPHPHSHHHHTPNFIRIEPYLNGIEFPNSHSPWCDIRIFSVRAAPISGMCGAWRVGSQHNRLYEAPSKLLLAAFNIQ